MKTVRCSSASGSWNPGASTEATGLGKRRWDDGIQDTAEGSAEGSAKSSGKMSHSTATDGRVGRVRSFAES